MRSHLKVSSSRISAPRAEPAHATAASAAVGHGARAVAPPRSDLPSHDLSRMSIGEWRSAKREQSGDAEAIPNNTGLPDRLKAGIEKLSGLAMDDVRVHYNSARPAAVQALAYAQGTDIHIGPGQQRYLPHEAWHVAQQKQGRVKPTLQIKGKATNVDAGLEREADHFGRKADSAVARRLQWPAAGIAGTMRSSVIQRAPFVTINDKQIDLGVLSITQLQALLKTTLNTGAMQAIEAQINELQQAKEVGNNAGGGSNISAIVKGGAGNDKKDSAGNNKGDDKTPAGGSTSQTIAVATHAAPKAGQKNGRDEHQARVGRQNSRCNRRRRSASPNAGFCPDYYPAKVGETQSRGETNAELGRSPLCKKSHRRHRPHSGQRYPDQNL